MSLISLLIALAAERYLSSSAWQFSVYYQRYLKLFKKLDLLGSPSKSTVTNLIFLFLPVTLCYALLAIVQDGLLHLIISTLILIACFGCFKTRDTYKQYLMAAFRGEVTTCSLYHKQLMQDKNLPDLGFGQTLVWLNYRYFIAIMLFFVLFGAPGALFYRLLSKLNESPLCQLEHEEYLLKANIKDVEDVNHEASNKPCNEGNKDVINLNQRLLFFIDWLPVRVVAFGYMLVGHFSRAFPVWMENLFAADKAPHYVLIDVAQKSEDFMVDQDDCTAEPCLLVRLAKRTLLLCLATVSMLIITGVLN